MRERRSEEEEALMLSQEGNLKKICNFFTPNQASDPHLPHKSYGSAAFGSTTRTKIIDQDVSIDPRLARQKAK